MKILSIETSCDETAVSIVEAKCGLTKPHFDVLGNSLFSQIKLHVEFGGVVPTLAKREHAKNLTPLLIETLTQAGMYKKISGNSVGYSKETWKHIESAVSKEEGLYTRMQESLNDIEKPDIDAIAVTYGPGLEPALWVGISFAEALGKLWKLPIVPVNHMEGHIASVLLHRDESNEQETNFPAVALLISGGHTEIVSVTGWGQYTVIGKTRDDAVGEAFDKVARLLGLPYPGGPEISRLAQAARESYAPQVVVLPRPMIHSDDLNFSFSGLKTAVLYYIRDYLTEHAELPDALKRDIAREFEDAVTEVLLKKTVQAIEETAAQTLIVAGGVISNKKLRDTFTALQSERNGLRVCIPDRDVTTDNSIMIACAAFLQSQIHPELLTKQAEKIIAKGNLSF